MKKFFDENNGRWISIYKGITIFLFFALIIGGIVFGIIDNDQGIIIWSYLALFIWPLIGIVCAMIEFTLNMLLIQVIQNVRLIKEKLSGTTFKEESKTE